jgi:RNA polymerase sigma-70 factor, ECF subfamily
VTEGRAAQSPADAVLVAAVAAGSEDALAALYDRHAATVHAMAFRIAGDRQVAEEVVQEVFLTLWNRADRFDPASGSLMAWLGTMARNRTIDRLRAAGRRPQLVALGRAGEDGSADEALERAAEGGRADRGDAADDPVAALEAGEARRAIAEALAGMPGPEREVILLAYRDDLTQREIAERLGWPLGTVKTRTRRALARLRETLADVYGPGLAPVPVVGAAPVAAPSAWVAGEASDPDDPSTRPAGPRGGGGRP